MRPRHEIKYHISPLEADALSRKLAVVMRRDTHADTGTGEYTIRSLYFDDAYNSAFEDKLDGVRDRDKYRLRIYLNGNPEARPANLWEGTPVSMERKRKMGDGIEKTAARVTPRLAGQLMRADPSNLESIGNPLLSDVACQMRTRLLRPAVIVEYDREAFTYPVEDVRITIDKRVRTGLRNIDLFDGGLRTVDVMEKGDYVLEVKYNDYLPDFLAGLLAGVSADRSAVSKYTLCRRFEPNL